MSGDITPEQARLELLKRVGRVVFGSGWQKEMAPRLNISSRTMIRWANAQIAVPVKLPKGDRLLPDDGDFLATMLDILKDHQQDIDSMVAIVNRVRDIMKQKGEA
jgi:hypothetical protein